MSRNTSQIRLDIHQLGLGALLSIRTIFLTALALSGCAPVPKPTPELPPPAALTFDPDKTRVSGDALDNAVQTWMKSQHIPGLALAVVVDGRVVESRGYG